MDYQKLYKNRKLYVKSYKTFDEEAHKDTQYAMGMPAQKFADIIIRELLGEDWYVVDPIHTEGVNWAALEEILTKYSPKFKGKGPKLVHKIYDRNLEPQGKQS